MPLYQYAIAAYGFGEAGTGLISVGAASKNVTGSGTSFTTELHIGDPIFSAGQTLAVATIADNTHLTLQSAAGAAITTTAFLYQPLTNVETLTTATPFAPKSLPKPWYQGVDTGDGLARGMGRPVTSWNFQQYTNQAFRDALRAYCTGKAARVFVRTRDIDSADSYNTYQAAMLWPDSEQREATRRLNFVIEIRDMVLL